MLTQKSWSLLIYKYTYIENKIKIAKSKTEIYIHNNSLEPCKSFSSHIKSTKTSIL